MNIKKIRSASFPYIVTFLIIFGTYCQLFAQKSPTAVLREIETGAALVQTLEATSLFKVETACKTNLIECYEVTATVYDGGDTGILFEDVEGDAAGAGKIPILNIEAAEKCGPGEFPTRAGAFCLKISEDDLLMVIYRFVMLPTLEKDKYSINLTIKRRPPADPPGMPAQVKGGYSAVANLEFPINDPEVAALSDTERTQNRNLKVMYTAGNTTAEILDNHNIIRVRIELPSKGDRLDEPKTQLKNARIVLRRVRAALAWLDRMESTPSAIANVEIDLRDGTGVKPYPLIGFAYLGQDKNRTAPAANPQCSSVEPDIPVAIQPITERERALFCESRLTLYLIGRDELPSKPFFFKVAFQQNPPLELALVAKATPTSTGIKSLAAPEAKAVGENTLLGLRSFNSNIDFGFAVTSSVKNEENVRKRNNNGAFDVMFAPILNKYLTGPRRWQLLTTPFFIDAKASVDEDITKDSLSLNRILIGSELGLLHLGKFTPGDLTHPADYDKYKFSFRFINASDRDFKRVEAKFNFETLIRLVALNKPLSQRFKSIPPSVLNPKAGPAAIPTGKFGYQIQPVFGFELGRVYRDKRAAFANENQELSVRRFYLGLDMQFDLTRMAKITLKDTFYIRGEVEQGRYRNHFLGELSTPLGKLGNRAAQSIFISFERGDQPPFVSPSVNSFKVGYRITANFFDNVILP
jgi:hypothetical protein